MSRWTSFVVQRYEKQLVKHCGCNLCDTCLPWGGLAGVIVCVAAVTAASPAGA